MNLSYIFPMRQSEFKTFISVESGDEKTNDIATLRKSV